MKVRGITWRWLANSVVLTLILVGGVQFLASVAVYQWFYNGLVQTMHARTEIYSTLFTATYSAAGAENFEKSAREFVETFEEKERMELMVLDQNGRIVITSTGFEPDNTVQMTDHTLAVNSPEEIGQWFGEQNGERIMAVTRVFHTNTIGGSIRLIISTELIDRQVLIIFSGILLVGLVVILFVIMTGIYFVRSIIIPVRQINMSAKKIAKGDFSIRLKKKKNDELGELCDTVNHMAQELALSEKMKNDFISSVSHELRTPLTAIKGWAETIEMCDAVENQQMIEKGVKTIAHEAERLSGLVEELLDFSRMQSGRLKMQKERMDMLAELEEAVYMLHERARRDQIRLEYEAPDMLSPILGDKNRIKQVFINIIENAIKYSDAGGLIEVSAFECEGYLTVSIGDNGCGIAPEDLPKVKQKFYKANMSRGGSGIGLAVADEIIRLHNGELNIESEKGVGTTVTIRLPAIQLKRNTDTSVDKTTK